MRFIRSLLRRCALALLLAAHAVPHCEAQPVVASDDFVRVRIWPAGSYRMRTLKGVVSRIGADYLEISDRADGTPQRIAINDIQHIERRVVDGTYAGRGAAIGFLGARSVTALIAYATTEPCGSEFLCFYGPSEMAVVGFVMGGFAGGVFGLVVGSRIERTSWDVVRLPTPGPRAHVSLRISPGSGIGVRLTF